jgi:hypothetical protein
MSDRKQEIEQKLRELNNTKYDWEFSGASDDRMKWLNHEIESYKELLKSL